jgi:hypothetical protein
MSLQVINSEELFAQKVSQCLIHGIAAVDASESLNQKCRVVDFGSARQLVGVVPECVSSAGSELNVKVLPHGNRLT